MELETKRLLLRPWDRSDAKDLFEVARDPEVGLRCGWKPHQNEEESAWIIENVLSNPYDFAIILKESGKAVGSISLMENRMAMPLGQENRKAMEAGFWLGRPFWKKQIMSEALSEILRFAFEDLGLDGAACGHADFNEGSHAIQCKMGFELVRITENSPVPLLDTNWTLVENYLTKDKWLAMHSDSAN